MSCRRGTLALLLAALAAGCGGPAHSEREFEQASTGAVDPPPPPATAGTRTIEPGGVDGKVAAIFGETVKVSTTHEPRHITGDFNGDGSKDLAIIVKPAAGALTEINGPVASWILKDVEPTTTREDAQHPLSVRVESADALLAVIHGYGAAGWRNPEARQTYLLRHAAGSGMQARPLEGLLATPRRGTLAGDVILLRRDGHRGFLFWTGASYHWHALDDAGQPEVL